MLREELGSHRAEAPATDMRGATQPLPRESKVQPELQTLQACRAFAASAVVFFHVNLAFASREYGGWEPWWFLRGGKSGVALFFVLSGMVIALAHWSEFGKPGDVRTFAWKRFRRVYLPLWAVLAPLTALSFLGLGDRPDFATAVRAFLILPEPREVLLGVEWTLRHELLFYLALGAYLFRPRIGVVAMGIWFAGCVVVPFVQAPFPWRFFFDPINLLFGMGLLAAIILKRNTVPRPLLVASVGLTLFMSGWSVRAIFNEPETPGLLLMLGAGSALILAGLAEAERQGRISAPRWIAFLGNASYSLYLVHCAVMAAVCKLGAALGVLGPAWFFLTLAACFAGGILFYLLVEKPILARTAFGVNANQKRAAAA